ncbi:MAG: DNA-directed RNA polymerase subunit omega [Ruminococcaceae bacterium]|nr:DNA-directed RNA polymerase subunit omega [Oscillospiraceae bacterium]
MIYPPIAELVKKTKTRYSLAILTARRARQLGAESEGEYAGKFDEAILKAIDEINDGKVSSRPKNYYFDYVNSANEASLEAQEVEKTEETEEAEAEQ